MKSIFTRWISGIIFIVLGALIAFGPQTIFEPCTGLLQTCTDGVPSNKFVPMKCHWAAIAEIGVGGSIALLGLLLLLFRQVQVRFGLSLAQLVLGIITVFIPTKLIGVCMMKTMQCNILMQPMLIVLGCVVIAVSLANVLLLFKEIGKG